MSKEGYVYLLCCTNENNVYKIGVTRGKLENRIKKLQTGNSGEIKLFKSYWTKYPFLLEKRLHLHYSNSNVLNEWYQLDYDEACNFETICKQEEKLIDSLENNPFMQKYFK